MRYVMRKVSILVAQGGCCILELVANKARVSHAAFLWNDANSWSTAAADPAAYVYSAPLSS